MSSDRRLQSDCQQPDLRYNCWPLIARTRKLKPKVSKRKAAVALLHDFPCGTVLKAVVFPKQSRQAGVTSPAIIVPTTLARRARPFES